MMGDDDRERVHVAVRIENLDLVCRVGSLEKSIPSRSLPSPVAAAGHRPSRPGIRRVG